MAVHILSQASAYNPGADLWILPESNQSKWNKRMDWYLNFQLVKSTRHQPLEIDKDLEETIDHCGLKEWFRTSKMSQLLIGSAHLLPNKFVLQVEGSEDFESWVAQIYKAWTEIGKPTLRIFLPTGKNIGDFNQFWHRESDFEDFTVVLD
jgi:hypothetical protein